MKKQFVMVGGVGLGVDMATTLPTRVKILNWGDNPNAKGIPVRLGKAALAFHAKAQCPFKRVALDYEHNTFPGTVAYGMSAEPRPVAGFGDIEIIEGDGAYITALSYNESGKANALHYTDVSAGVLVDKATGEVQAIASVGLCRNGCVADMQFKQVPLSSDLTILLAGAGEDEDEEPNKKDTIMREMLIKLLGLAPEATDEDVTKAVTALVEKSKATPVPLGVEIEKLKTEFGAKLEAFGTCIAALNADNEKRQKDAILMDARVQGKAVALGAEIVGKLSVADLRAHVDALPVTVPMHQRTVTTVAEVALGADAGPTEAQRAVALSCGMDPDVVFPKKAK